MSFGDSGETGRSKTSGTDEARSDWDRYAHGPAAQAPTAWSPNSLSNHPAAARPRPAERDDLDVEYRYESGFTPSNEGVAARGPRFTANVIGVAAVGLAGLLVAAFALVTSTGPTPSPSASPTAKASVTLGPVTAPPASPQLAHVGTVVTLPLVIRIADRSEQPDNGTTIYLMGPSGGVSVDPSTGRVLKVYGGAAFANGMRRAVVASGIWISSWPEKLTSCGPTCWTQATTYRLDPATGSVTKTLKGTYLIGTDGSDLWVATGDRVERLDPAGGETLDWTPWKKDSEPRVGCGSLWAYSPSNVEPGIARIAQVTGNVLETAVLPSGVTYGPAVVDGACWMMSGSGGVSAGSTMLVQVTGEGGPKPPVKYAKSMLTLNGRFWTYTDGTLQMFDAGTGVGYGIPFTLAERPSGNDPSRLFSAVGGLWMIADGGSLEGFDLPTDPVPAT